MRIGWLAWLQQASPGAPWQADQLKLPFIYVRSKPKEHGMGNQIEDIMKKENRCS